MKNKLKIILPVLLVSSSVFVLFQIKKDLVSTSSPTQTSDKSINTTDQNTTPTIFQKLSVLANRCRGCGRCVQIDPVHFEMINGVAQVISSTNLTSQNLTIAINNCRDQAITLE